MIGNYYLLALPRIAACHTLPKQRCPKSE